MKNLIGIIFPFDEFAIMHAIHRAIWRRIDST